MGSCFVLHDTHIYNGQTHNNDMAHCTYIGSESGNIQIWIQLLLDLEYPVWFRFYLPHIIKNQQALC